MNVIEEVLSDAHAMAERGSWISATNRAYYAMFYAAQHYLTERHFTETRNLKTHKGTAQKFNELAIVRDGLPKNLGQQLSSAAQMRTKFDYDFDGEGPSERDARDMLAVADHFVTTVLEAARARP